ncbi:prepilin-type N-terminal cleavage/methylation domain-containing protein [Desulfococcaceae bacterium HSG8]|nr:prepilin-type N-terminal cleavage/methylation domain-containing protein [Desulfococcaceae bacterium HSG8]
MRIRTLSVGKTSGDKGFSLLELLVVLVLMSLVSALVAPRLSGSLDSMNSKTTARKIAASLRYARSQAASQGITHIAVFDGVKKRLTITTSPEAPEDEADRAKIYDLPGEIRMEGRGADHIRTDPFQIAFYPSGSSSGGEIFITDEKERLYKITVDFITGTVRLIET